MKNLTKGLLFGSFIGGISGLLLAPRSGKATRQKLSNEIEEWSDLKDDLAKKIDKVKESALTLQESADIYIDPFITGMQKDINNFNFQAKPRIEQIQDHVEKIKANLPE